MTNECKCTTKECKCTTKELKVVFGTLRVRDTVAEIHVRSV